VHEDKDEDTRKTFLKAKRETFFSSDLRQTIYENGEKVNRDVA
jgi:hypothetical protein